MSALYQRLQGYRGQTAGLSCYGGEDLRDAIIEALQVSGLLSYAAVDVCAVVLELAEMAQQGDDPDFAETRHAARLLRRTILQPSHRGTPCES